MRHLLALVPAAVLALGAAACGDDEHDHGSEGTSSGGNGSTACERDTRKDMYTAGLSRSGGDIKVDILDAVPAPPRKGDNVLTLAIVDAAGRPIDGAAIAIVPFMPDHGHGSAVTPQVKAVGGGRYEVERVYLAMAGLWEIRVNVQPTGGAPASEVTFRFCLDG